MSPCLRTSCVLLTLFVYSMSTSVLAQQKLSVIEKQQKRIEVIKRIAPSVVCVMPATGQGGGSGVLISSDGYAISNYHVTSGSGDFMKCGLNDGKLYDAVIVGIDPTGDVALIKLLGRDDFPACTPGNSDLVKAGDEVLALGNPFLLASDFSPTVTYGIVSGTHRYQYPAGTFLEYTDCIQIDASINPGNSGGPLFDIEGNWIGINGRASFEKRGRINSGAAYAISVRQVLLFIDHLKSGRIVDHGRTEFTVTTAADGVVEVQDVSQISEAGRRGLSPGNELVSFAGRSLTSANDFKNILGIFPAGTRVPLTWRNRDGIQRATVRLNALHGFASAPQLPQQRRPQRPPRPQPDTPDPDQPRARPKAEKKPEPPSEYAHLFEKKEGFTNHYFNKLHRDEILGELQKLLGHQSGSSGSTWILQLEHPDAQIETTGELIVGEKAVGLLGDGWPVSHQKRDEIDASNEPLRYWGLLAGSLQWHRMFRNDTSLFSEVVYHGTDKILPSERRVHVLITKDGATIARWYFDEESPLPVGVDTAFSAGEDESRLRFDKWVMNSEVPYPGRLGIVDSDTEQVTWIKVLELQPKAKAAPTAAKQTPENGVRS